MLEGRHGVYYIYHFPLLDHFCNREFVSIPFFLLHALEDTIIDVREKKEKVANFTILQQGLMFHLSQFHLALYPPCVISTSKILPFGAPYVWNLLVVAKASLLNPRLAKPLLREGKTKF